METITIKKQPSIPEIMKGIGVGESKRIKLLGTVYNAILSARTRLRREGMDFDTEIDHDVNEMIITRIK